MRFTQLFGQTLRDAPSDAITTSHQLLSRAGYLRALGQNGAFAALHLGQRSLSRLSALLCREMQALGGQEIGLLASAALPTLTDLIGREVQSYKHLPRLLYATHTSTDAPNQPTFGLIPTRSNLRLSAWGASASQNEQNQQAHAIEHAFMRVINQCGVSTLPASSGPTARGLYVASPSAETAMLACDACGQTWAQDIAPFRRADTPPQTPAPIEKVLTPNCKTIAELAAFLGMPTSQTAKAVLLVARMDDAGREQFVFAVVRGDTDLSETKLSAVLQAVALRPASEAEIRAVGAVPGFASPVGLKSVFVVVDDAVAHTPNLVSGANESDYHLLNVNYGRDYTAQIVADIAAAPDDARCPTCAAPMRRFFASPLAHIATHPTPAAGSTFLDRDGKPKPIHLTSAWLDLTRLLAAAAEQNHDAYGLSLAAALAPYPVHLVALKGGFDAAERLYADLTAAGIGVLFDDREESPGVKFNDADLIGLPIRITAAEKSLAQGGVEFKLRRESARRVVALAQVIDEVRRSLQERDSLPAADDIPPSPSD